MVVLKIRNCTRSHIVNAAAFSAALKDILPFFKTDNLRIKHRFRLFKEDSCKHISRTFRIFRRKKVKLLKAQYFVKLPYENSFSKKQTKHEIHIDFKHKHNQIA